MASGNGQSRPKRRSNNAYRAVGEDGGLVVVPSESKVEVLNPVGSRIYALIDGKRTRGEILKTIMEELDVTEETARRDLEEFLSDLESRQLVEEDADGDAPQAEPA